MNPGLNTVTIDMVEHLLYEQKNMNLQELIGWSCPVPLFGNLASARIATIGLNPSSSEFVDRDGRELEAPVRRLSTLSSLHLASWDDAEEEHLYAVIDSYTNYFSKNPYRRWFDVLDRLLAQTSTSYYGSANACHLDLVAHATTTKWGALPTRVSKEMMTQGRNSFLHLLKSSDVRLVVLNGMAVVRAFQNLLGVNLEAEVREEWNLPRIRGGEVRGYAFTADMREAGKVDFGRSIKVVGYNHNLQSSFGVSRSVVEKIGHKIKEEFDAIATDD